MYFWEELTDEELLDLKLSDLGLSVENSLAAPRVARLHKELSQKGLHFRPHTWVSDDWFSPDGIPGIAIPFYTLHPRLIKLERKMMGFVEGPTERSFMKLLRHEAGHAIDNAFKLRGNQERVELFGRASEPYPKDYTYKPYSKAYVRHIGEGYAQAHPEEDWAETFAVWLTPKSAWRQKYKNWGAMSKLKYIQKRMMALKGKKPVNNCKDTLDILADEGITLRKYYAKKVLSKRVVGRPFFGGRLKKIFSPIGKIKGEQVLRSKKKQLRKSVAQKAGLYQYQVEPMLKDLLNETKATDLYLKAGKRELEAQLTKLLVQESSRFKRQGRHRIIM